MSTNEPIPICTAQLLIDIDLQCWQMNLEKWHIFYIYTETKNKN